MEIISINDKEVELNKFIEMAITDLGAGGMRTSSYLNLPHELEMVLRLFFRFEGETFIFQGKLIRKIEKDTFSEYGIQFINVSESEQRRLMQTINKYQLKRIKTARSGSAIP